MKQAITALIAMTCFASIAVETASAQPGTVAVGFTNKSDFNVVVTGYTVVNGSKRTGPALQVRKNGGRAFENNVPTGIRIYTILDATTFTTVGQVQVPIQNRDATFEIVPTPANPRRLTLIPSQ